MTGPQPPQTIVVRVVKLGVIESFKRELAGGSAEVVDTALRNLVDYYEANVGTVLSVTSLTTDQRLYKGMVEPWEAGVR